MASAFGHAFSAYIIGKGFNKELLNWKFWVLGIACSILPDLDVIGFALGVPYESFWGHRGFSHSILFALLTGFLIVLIFYRNTLKTKTGIWLTLYFFLCTASHGVLDALTSGGLGIAFFSPFDNSRYFFPWQPILVSPIGISDFFSKYGLAVLLSELLWIGIPGSLILIIKWVVRKKSPLEGR